mmetsp:Transcript_91658/g.163129  ORF Transcript_91658/g.163129 Transcript_91658/m.163129 type:complete len:443 (-) Transcript_91658:147-1475(-)
MKFGRELLEHIRKCELNPDPCRQSDYVDYKRLKKRIKSNCTEVEFQELYEEELLKLTARLISNDALVRDPEYARINRTALDKISKKFDKQLHGQIRAANWVTTSRELQRVLGALQVDNAFIPPDLRHSPSPAHESSSSGPSSSSIFCAGAFSGIMSRTLTAPLDRIKVMLQAGNAPTLEGQAAPHRWENRGKTGGRVIGATRAILTDGGIRAFWQGNGANVIKVMPESAVKFLVYDKVKAFMSNSGFQLPVSERLLAGSVAGCVSQLAVYPLDVIKTRMAVSPVATYTGIYHCIQSTVVHEGPWALYKGIGPALMAIVPACGIDLAVYNTLKANYSERAMQEGLPEEMPIALSLCYGAVSATCGAVVAYPLTVLRTRLAVQGMPGRPVKYVGVTDCALKIWRKSGPAGLYRGLTPALAKTVPAVSIGWGAFEAAKRFAAAVL